MKVLAVILYINAGACLMAALNMGGSQSATMFLATVICAVLGTVCWRRKSKKGGKS
jgi:hypothetical protein